MCNDHVCMRSKTWREAHIVHKLQSRGAPTGKSIVVNLGFFFLLQATHPYVKRILKNPNRTPSGLVLHSSALCPLQENCLQVLWLRKRTGRHDRPNNTYRSFRPSSKANGSHGSRVSIGCSWASSVAGNATDHKEACDIRWNDIA